MCNRLLLLALIVFPVFADDHPLNFGFMGGLNIAYMSGTEIEAMEREYGSSNPTLSGNGGIRFGYSFQKWLEVETGLFLSGNGFEVPIKSGGGGIDWSSGMPRSVDVNYYSVRRVTLMEFPVAVKFRTPYSSEYDLRFYAFGGIRPGIITSAVEKIVGETVTSNFPDPGESTDREDLMTINLFENRTLTDSSGNSVHYAFKDFYRRGNFSLQFGFGVEKRYLNVGLFLQGQYVFSLLNFNKLSDKARQELAMYNSGSTGSGVVFLGEPEAFFRSIQISAGLNIFIPKRY